MLTKVGPLALFCMEAPEVWFFDVVRVPVKGKAATVTIDPLFVEVCEPNTLAVLALAPDRLVKCAGNIIAKRRRVTRLRVCADRPTTITVTIAGIRKGFADIRFPARTVRQMALNNQRWRHLSAA
jgi:hypothetical protein